MPRLLFSSMTVELCSHLDWVIRVILIGCKVDEMAANGASGFRRPPNLVLSAEGDVGCDSITPIT